MDKKTTVFLAKKLFTELVFNTAYIEGVNVTFPQTTSFVKSTKWSLAMKAWLGEACEQEKLASAEQNICLKYPGKMR